MSLRRADRWVRDFWVAIDGDDVHLFHLRAPRSLGDPEPRHRNATLGHACASGAPGASCSGRPSTSTARRASAARVVEHRGTPWLLAWRRHDEAGRFVGELEDPMAVEVRPDGSLVLAGEVRRSAR